MYYISYTRGHKLYIYVVQIYKGTIYRLKLEYTIVIPIL